METADEAPKAINEIGPVQILTVAFEGNKFKGEIFPELERLKLAGIIRVIDLLFVRKDAQGAIARLTASDLDWEEATDFGAVIGGLVGWGAGGAAGAASGAIAGAAALADGHLFDEEDEWLIVSSIPPNTSAAIALIEHTWAIPLRTAIARAEGYEVATDWLRGDDLIAAGLAIGDITEGEDRDPD